MRRQLQHIIKSEEYLTNLDTREPSVIAFKVENLQCKVSINPDNSFQSLHLKVAPDDPSQWQPDQLTIIQKFFDAKVSQKLKDFSSSISLIFNFRLLLLHTGQPS